MIPLSDDNSLRKTTPVMTYLLIFLNIVVFFLEMAGGEPFILKWSFIPKRFIDDPTANYQTIFTAMFMHSGMAHLTGNMLYLWIFGDNVEDNFGKGKFLIFYLLSGVAATFAQLFFTPGSNIPNLGASGAIAGGTGSLYFAIPQW
ncbi:MAG: rhomboid family intramembrane serine protease [Parachlamydiaceae bacterium]